MSEDIAGLARLMREETDRIAKQVLGNYSNTFTIATSKKENDMNVTADVVPTVGGFRGIVRRTRTNHAEMTNEVVVVWESAKVYKTYEKAKAAAERRIDEGVKAVFG